MIQEQGEPTSKSGELLVHLLHEQLIVLWNLALRRSCLITRACRAGHHSAQVMWPALLQQHIAGPAGRVITPLHAGKPFG